MPGGVAADHMADFMGKDRCQFLGGVGLVDQAAEKDNLASGQGKGVDHLMVEDMYRQIDRRWHMRDQTGLDLAQGLFAIGRGAKGDRVQVGVVQRLTDLGQCHLSQCLFAAGWNVFSQLVSHQGDQNKQDQRHGGNRCQRPTDQPSTADKRCGPGAIGQAWANVAVAQDQTGNGIALQPQDDQIAAGLIHDLADVVHRPVDAVPGQYAAVGVDAQGDWARGGGFAVIEVTAGFKRRRHCATVRPLFIARPPHPTPRQSLRPRRARRAGVVGSRAASLPRRSANRARKDG